MKLKIWFAETRPQFLLLSVVLAFLGSSVAWYDSLGTSRFSFHWGHALLAALGLLLCHISVNVLNDYFDYKSGIDIRTKRTHFSGGSGILPHRLMQPQAALIFGFAALGVTAAIGVFFWIVWGWGILPLGLLGILLVIFYSPWVTKHPFICLIAPGVGFGPLMVMGTHYVLVGRYDLVALFASFIPGFLVSNLLLINQFPDVKADAAGKRRHILIVFGRRAGAWVYASFAVATFLWVALAWRLGYFPAGTLLALLFLPLALATIKGLFQNAERVKPLIPYLGKNVIYTLATPLLLGIGFMIS